MHLWLTSNQINLGTAIRCGTQQVQSASVFGCQTSRCKQEGKQQNHPVETACTVSLVCAHTANGSVPPATHGHARIRDKQASATTWDVYGHSEGHGTPCARQ